MDCPLPLQPGDRIRAQYMGRPKGEWRVTVHEPNGEYACVVETSVVVGPAVGTTQYVGPLYPAYGWEWEMIPGQITWTQFEAAPPVPETPKGSACRRCKTWNEYAQPNFHICWGCKQDGWGTTWGDIDDGSTG